MHTLTDSTFGRIARGELNPGRELLPPALAERACDTADMRDNLWILYGLACGWTRPAVAQRRPVRILEIGVSDGTSTLAFLKAVHDMEMGDVTSIDIVDVPVAQALVEQFGLQERWRFIKNDSKEVLRTFKDEGKEFDIILIDGDHTYEGAVRDFVLSENRLSSGGFILLHDSLLMSVDHSWDKDFGHKGTPGCGMLARAVASGYSTLGMTGFVLPFGYNLYVMRRQGDFAKMLNEAFEADRKRGLLL